jgi:uncharacterized protein (DUF1810 family)
VDDPYSLQRFRIQHQVIFEDALREVRAGEKRTHWMWFIFPQLRGLGHSPASQYYAIASPHEARAYLNDPILGPNLREGVEALLSWSHDRTAEQILGTIDAMKLCSCLTLFDQVEPEGIFASALHAFYGGQRDERTLALLNAQA